MNQKNKTIILSIIFIIFILIYCFAEGATEGFTWASEQERLNNKIISHNFHQGEGLLDYHSFRNLELLGICGAIITALFLGLSLKRFILLLIGSFAFGLSLVYERVLQYVAKGYLFEPHPPQYNILWFSFQSSNILEIIVGLIGILLIIFYFYLLNKANN